MRLCRNECSRVSTSSRCGIGLKERVASGVSTSANCSRVTRSVSTCESNCPCSISFSLFGGESVFVGTKKREGESYDEAEAVTDCKELSERLSRSPKHLDALHSRPDPEFLGVSTQLRWVANRYSRWNNREMFR